jgi:hypothetical protein
MARIFTTGAEEFDPDAVWTSVTQGANKNYPLISVADLSQRLTSGLLVPPRTGQACWTLNYNNNQDWLTFTFPATKTEIFLGFAWYGDVLPSTGTKRLLQFSGPNTTLDIKNGGILSAFGQDSGTAMSADTWHYIEIHYIPLNSGGTFTLKLDGVTVIDFSGDTTSSQEYISGINFFSGTENNYTGAFDDIVINDTSGSVNNSWPGIVRLLPMRPRAAGSDADWSRAGLDLGANFLQAARVGKFGTLPLLQASATTLRDSYLVDIPDLPAGATIKNVIAVARATVGSGSGNIKLGVMGNLGTEDQGAAQALTAAYKVYNHVVALNPEDSAAWEEADINDIQVSIESA